ncbi:MAG: zf-HC2 domain-containing protein [Clostridiales bacterium]|nr:zf-HC2 domain-containing protein [Clostridiales bacterium]
MKEIDCEMIQDLLPGYIDDVISDVSRDAVEQHLEACSACKAVYEDMSEAMEPVADRKKVPDFAGVLRKTERYFFRKGVLLSFVVCLLLACVWKLYEYAVTPMPVPPEAVSVDWQEEGDGSLTLNITVDSAYLVDVSGGGWLEDENTYYFYAQTNRTQIDQKLGRIPLLGQFFGHEAGLNEYAITFSPKERKDLKVIYKAKDDWSDTGMDERIVVYDSKRSL